MTCICTCRIASYNPTHGCMLTNCTPLMLLLHAALRLRRWCPSCSFVLASRLNGRQFFGIGRRNESDDDYLSRVTHLRLQNKGISSLDNPDVFDACHSLKVLPPEDVKVPRGGSRAYCPYHENKWILHVRTTCNDTSLHLWSKYLSQPTTCVCVYHI